MLQGSFVHPPKFFLLLLLVMVAPAALRAAPPKQAQWLPNYDHAIALAHKQDKPIIAYFSGSDWDPWCQKLEKDVLETELFRQWAEQNAILLRIDFPKNRRSSSRAQDEKLKLRYSVSKTPTFIFLDQYGQPFARAGYDDVRLHEEEQKGEPKAAIAFLDSVLKTRPRDEPLMQQPGLTQALAYAKQHYATVLLLITQGNARGVLQTRDELLANQQFVKFVNRSVVFVQLQWPEDTDVSKPAESLRAWLAKEKISPAPIQLVVWELPDKMKARITAFSPDHVDRLIAKIQAQLPRIDYTGGWLTDYNTARTIAAQQDRFVFLAFTSMDASDWSRKMDTEIFQSPQFKAYAKKNLVLLRADFPTATTQPSTVATQNKLLAEMYNVRGYPLVVVINPLGQKVADSKYLKGGPDYFLSQLEPILKHDKERRALLRDE